MSARSLPRRVELLDRRVDPPPQHPPPPHLRPESRPAHKKTSIDRAWVRPNPLIPTFWWKGGGRPAATSRPTSIAIRSFDPSIQGPYREGGARGRPRSTEDRQIACSFTHTPLQLFDSLEPLSGPPRHRSVSPVRQSINNGGHPTSMMLKLPTAIH